MWVLFGYFFQIGHLRLNTFAKKRTKIGPPLILLWLSEAHVSLLAYESYAIVPHR